MRNIPAPSAFSQSERRLFHNRKTAAIQLSISLRSFNSYIAAGEIKIQRLGRSVRIPRGELVRFAQKDHFDSCAE